MLVSTNDVMGSTAQSRNLKEQFNLGFLPENKNRVSSSV